MDARVSNFMYETMAQRMACVRRIQLRTYERARDDAKFEG